MAITSTIQGLVYWQIVDKRKDFDKWNTCKKKLHYDKDRPFYHEREIWWCATGINIGVETDGKGTDHGRPVLVLKGFNKQSFLGVALTGHKKQGEYYVFLGKVKDRYASVNLSQIRLFDTKRLVNKMGTLDKNKFEKIRKAVKDLL